LYIAPASIKLIIFFPSKHGVDKTILMFSISTIHMKIL
jgi:hypothetical protein